MRIPAVIARILSLSFGRRELVRKVRRGEGIISRDT